MNIIGIYPGHNATAGFFRDGACVYIFHEEKFNNIKNYHGFPEKSLNHLSMLIDFTSIDLIIFGMKYPRGINAPDAVYNIYEKIGTGRLKKYYDYLEYKTGWKWFFTGLRKKILHTLISPQAWENTYRWLEARYGFSSDKVCMYDHHFSHCITPFFFYDLAALQQDLLLCSMDGFGDDSFTKTFVYRHKEKIFEKLADSPDDSSLGMMYQEMTKYLGMKPNEHEYIVMGLAAYVSDERYYRQVLDGLKKIISFDENTLAFSSAFNMFVSSLYYRDRFIGQRFDNLAAAVQKITEEMTLRWVKAMIKKTDIHTLAFSGGVFMNVKMNQKIAALPEIRKMYFQPSCGDESVIIGAAGAKFLEKGISLKSMRSMMYGHAYSNEDVCLYLKNNGCFDNYEIDYIEDINAAIVDCLARFEIVALFRGSGEWGARSLCNRAILGNASDMKTFYMVNDMIKMRDFWMPFAPTILDEWADRYIRNWNDLKSKIYESSKYMIVTFDTTELAERHLRAAMHQKDKSIRPQIVSQVDRPELYSLLKCFESKTGMGGFMNTSLNIHGYPLAGTLEQGMFTFAQSGLRRMAVENWLITKKSS